MTTNDLPDEDHTPKFTSPDGTPHMHIGHEHASVYDTGGTVHPGLTHAHNLAGANEPLINSAQFIAPEPRIPTQIAHPWRATARTVVAWVVAVVVFLVAAIPIALEVAGPYLPPWFAGALAAALTVLTVLVTLATRLMQLPQAQPFLEILRLGPRPRTPETPAQAPDPTSSPTP